MERPRIPGSPCAGAERQATRIVTLDGQTVDHLETRGSDGSALDIQARHYVVAAGTIESARLLLLSRSPWFPNGLGNQYDLLGRHFNVHPSLQTWFKHDRTFGQISGGFRTYTFNNLYRREGLNACHFQLVVRGPNKVRLRAEPEIEPRGENRVSLNRSQADRFGNPLPDVRLTYSERDKRTFARAREVLRQARNDLGAREGSVRDLTRWEGHPAGTCRMGFDERTGVVDANNRVFEMENLFVSGACTFPTSGTANPTCTVVAMTLRLADHLTALMANGA